MPLLFNSAVLLGEWNALKRNAVGVKEVCWHCSAASMLLFAKCFKSLAADFSFNSTESLRIL